VRCQLLLVMSFGSREFAGAEHLSVLTLELLACALEGADCVPVM
jgi:hypothetical protein